MKIIDFERKGNVVRFYLGADNLKEYYGDDWDDRPYDCNAGKVYDEYIGGHVDIVFPFDYMVLESSDDWDGNNACKDDMVARILPCIIAVPPEVYGDDYWSESFRHWVGADNILKFYFGDNMDRYENNSTVVLSGNKESGKNEKA